MQKTKLTDQYYSNNNNFSSREAAIVATAISNSTKATVKYSSSTTRATNTIERKFPTNSSAATEAIKRQRRIERISIKYIEGTAEKLLLFLSLAVIAAIINPILISNHIIKRLLITSSLFLIIPVLLSNSSSKLLLEIAKIFLAENKPENNTNINSSGSIDSSSSTQLLNFILFTNKKFHKEKLNLSNDNSLNKGLVAIEKEEFKSSLSSLSEIKKGSFLLMKKNLFSYCHCQQLEFGRFHNSRKEFQIYNTKNTVLIPAAQKSCTAF